MIYKNGKIIMNSSEGLFSLQFNGSLTSGNRKNLIANINELDNVFGEMDGKTLIVTLADGLREISDKHKRGMNSMKVLESKGMGLIDDIIASFQPKINSFLENYVLEEDELKNLSESDYRHAYNQGDKTYKEEEYIGLLELKIHSVLYMFIILTYTTDTHPNKIDTIFTNGNVIKHSSYYDRLKRFIIGHTDSKPSIIIEIGELMNVIPLVDNVVNILTIQACMKLAYSPSRKLIASVYSVIRLSRNPQVTIFSKSTNGESEDASWVTSFRQTSEVSLGQVGEIQEYFSDINELCKHYGIKDGERHLIQESNDMCDILIEESKYGTHINLSPHIDVFINPLISSIIQPSYIKYLDVEQMINIMAMAYVLSMRVSKEFAYLLHTVDMDTDKSVYEHMINDSLSPTELSMEGMAVNIPASKMEEVTKELFYDDDPQILKEIISKAYSSLAKAIGISIRGGYVVDSYSKLKPDYLEYLRMTMSI